jgi:hypothetical protein
VQGTQMVGKQSMYMHRKDGLVGTIGSVLEVNMSVLIDLNRTGIFFEAKGKSNERKISSFKIL